MVAKRGVVLWLKLHARNKLMPTMMIIVKLIKIKYVVTFVKLWMQEYIDGKKQQFDTFIVKYLRRGTASTAPKFRKLELPPWYVKHKSWWRHQMKTFSALLALCAGNSPVTGKFPSQGPVTRNFDVFFDLCLNKRWSKWGWWFGTPSCSLCRLCNVCWCSRGIPVR